MDSDLLNELERVMNMTEDKKRGTTRLAKYLLQLEPVEHVPEVVIRFIKHSYDVLKANNLPGQLSKKYNVFGIKKRRVSMGNKVDYDLELVFMSEEGKRQRKRESLVKSRLNIDSSIKFAPEYLPTPLENNTSKVIYLYDMGLKNTYEVGEPKGRAIFDCMFDVKSVIEDPSILKVKF